DDAIETFYMNLFHEGRLGCFSPSTYLSRKNITVIRPMVLATEQDVRNAVNEAHLPIVKSLCPADGVTTRQQTKEFINEKVRTDRSFRSKMLNAFQKGDLSGWGICEN
ncbi:MAG: tRNA 2-thiocytidine(32) synthetase TtcA, partial [Oscillospiraceae bacterium]